MYPWLWLLLAVACPGDQAASVEVPRVLCGRVLADARVLYCYGADTRKRDLGAGVYLDSPRDESWLTYDDNDAGSWLSSHEAREARELSEAAPALSSLRLKRNHGIVDECCHKACYVSELMSYC